MARFAIEHLSGDQLLEAWPVVRLAQAHANCDWWMSDAAALIERGGRPFDRTERYAIRYPRTWQSRLEHGDYSEFRIGYRSKS